MILGTGLFRKKVEKSNFFILILDSMEGEKF